METKKLECIITTLLIILSVSTAAMIYLSNAKAVAFDQATYEKEYAKYNIKERVGPEVDLSKETAFLIAYLESGSGEIQTDFFNQREKTHLVEVRAIFRTVQTLRDIAVFLSVISLVALIYLIRRAYINLSDNEAREYYKKTLSKLLIWTGAIVDGIAVLFALMAATFTSTFIKFHQLFFKTETWMLDPATDNLIRMFPEAFFYDLFVKIVLISVVLATFMLAVGYLMRLGKPKMFQK
jgi:integral membrane protein (TIGR01906 family)